jgi:hypothetical protein
MKNTIKLFGIITLAVIIGFSMTACDPEKEDTSDFTFTIKVVNFNLSPITEVSCFYFDNYVKKVNINDGGSQTFTATAQYFMDGEKTSLGIDTYPNRIYTHLTPSNSSSAREYFTLKRDGNYTATLWSDGTFSIQPFLY